MVADLEARVRHQLLGLVLMIAHPLAAREKGRPHALVAQAVDDAAVIAGHVVRLLAQVEGQRHRLVARRHLDPANRILPAAKQGWRQQADVLEAGRTMVRLDGPDDLIPRLAPQRLRAPQGQQGQRGIGRPGRRRRGRLGFGRRRGFRRDDALHRRLVGLGGWRRGFDRPRRRNRHGPAIRCGPAMEPGPPIHPLALGQPNGDQRQTRPEQQHTRAEPVPRRPPSACS